MNRHHDLSPAACHDDVCITCSDEAVEVRILEVRDNGLALVETANGPEEVSTALVVASVSDVVLVHAKEAIAVLPRDVPARPAEPSDVETTPS